MNGVANNRVLYWDVIKCIAIYLVIWGHCIMFLTTRGEWKDPVVNIIFSFHMPFFMMVSGYFARSVFKQGIMEIIIRKGRQLLLPSVSLYFFVGVILIAVRNERFIDGLVSLMDYCSKSFWFLKALFIFYFLTTILIKLWRKSWFLSLALIILGGAIIPTEWLNYVNGISMYPYFLIGLLYYKYEDIILKRQIAIALISLAIYMVMSSFNDVADYQMYTNLFSWSSRGISVFVVRTIIGISASLFLILLIRAICIKSRNHHLLMLMGNIGTCTLGIYVFQYYMVERLLILTKDKYEPIIAHFSNWAIDLIVAPFYSFVVLLFCWQLVKLVRINRYTRLIILGEK